MIIEVHLFKVNTKVIFKDGSSEHIPYMVYARSDYMAMKMVRDYLESGKSGYQVKEIHEQHVVGGSSFLWDKEETIVSYDNLYKMM